MQNLEVAIDHQEAAVTINFGATYTNANTKSLLVRQLLQPVSLLRAEGVIGL